MVIIGITSCPDFESLNTSNSPLISLLHDLFYIMNSLDLDTDNSYGPVIDDILDNQGVNITDHA